MLSLNCLLLADWLEPVSGVLPRPEYISSRRFIQEVGWLYTQSFNTLDMRSKHTMVLYSSNG